MRLESGSAHPFPLFSPTPPPSISDSFLRRLLTLLIDDKRLDSYRPPILFNAMGRWTQYDEVSSTVPVSASCGTYLIVLPCRTNIACLRA